MKDLPPTPGRCVFGSKRKCKTSLIWLAQTAFGAGFRAIGLERTSKHGAAITGVFEEGLGECLFAKDPPVQILRKLLGVAAALEESKKDRECTECRTLPILTLREKP